MANIKTTAAEWERAREYFESGLTLDKITEKTGISKSAISKKSRAEGWSKETGKPLLIQKAIDVFLAKETLNETAVSVHNELVDERTRHIAYFNDASYKVTQKALQVLDEKDDISTGDIRNVSEVVAKQREGVLGKAPDVAVQVNNGVEHPREIRITAG